MKAGSNPQEAEAMDTLRQDTSGIPREKVTKVASRLKEYSSPELMVYGSLAELTASTANDPPADAMMGTTVTAF